jgi:integrase
LYARCVKTFSRWAWRDGRLREDPIATMSPPKVVTRRVRSALPPEDARSLIEHTRSLPPRCGLTGEDRSALYALALSTGFRRGELASLTPEDFDLDHDTPTVTCRANYTKNRTEAVQPVPLALADMLRAWVASKPVGVPIFPGLGNVKTGNVIRADLRALGMDAPGVDFHSLRHSFISRLALSDAPPKIVQALARHSDPRLTFAVYAHVRLHDMSKHVETLALTLPTPPVSEGRKRTG